MSAGRLKRFRSSSTPSWSWCGRLGLQRRRLGRSPRLEVAVRVLVNNELHELQCRTRLTGRRERLILGGEVLNDVALKVEQLVREVCRTFRISGNIHRGGMMDTYTMVC